MYIYIYICNRICPLTFPYANVLGGIFFLACPYMRIAAFLAWPVWRCRRCPLRVPAPAAKRASRPLFPRASRVLFWQEGAVLQPPSRRASDLELLSVNAQEEWENPTGHREWGSLPTLIPWLIVPPRERPSSGLKSTHPSERIASF